MKQLNGGIFLMNQCNPAILSLFRRRKIDNKISKVLSDFWEIDNWLFHLFYEELREGLGCEVIPDENLKVIFYEWAYIYVNNSHEIWES